MQINSVGNGYYNYYGIDSRYKTPDGKAMEVWYERDLSTEEINSNNSNSGPTNRESQGADICRKVADSFQGVAAANRARYSDPEKMKSAVWAKYQASGNYKHLTHEQRTALARTEINMTMFGYVNLPDAKIVAEIKGEVTKNKPSMTTAEDREFNRYTLSKQIANVFKNNGIQLSIFEGKSFKFSVNGMSYEPTITSLDNNEDNLGLLDQMTKALNTNNNAKNLFSNLLYDLSKQSLIPTDQLSKWKLFSDFKNITGRDIRDFKQTPEGFFDKDGISARDIYLESLEHSNKVPAEFKGDAFKYFKELEKDALRYDISKVQNLTLSLEYINGDVRFSGETKSFNANA